MEYLKPHLSIPEQAELLIERGLEADASLLEKRLSMLALAALAARRRRK